MNIEINQGFFKRRTLEMTSYKEAGISSIQQALRSLFEPKTVAVVGASKNPKKWGYRALQLLIKYQYKGEIFPINPKYKSVLGYPCYSDIVNVPKPVDVALVTVPAENVPIVLRSCGRAKVPVAVVFASGYGEIGTEGKKRENELIEGVQKGVYPRILGPNLIGAFNLLENVSLSVTGVALRKNIPKGDFALIAQSGAIMTSTVSFAIDENIGFSYLVSTGNEVDITLLDILEYCLMDNRTQAVSLFVESVGDGKRFKRLAAKALEINKPITVIKAGRLAAGSDMVKTHSGRMAGDDAVYDAVFKKFGVLRVYEFSDLYRIPQTILSFKNKFPQKGNVGIMSTSGGLDALLADTAESHGIKIGNLEKTTLTQLQNILPNWNPVSNPLDISGLFVNDPVILTECAKALLSDKNLDLLLIGLTVGENYVNFAYKLEKCIRYYNKPVLVLFEGGSLVNRGKVVFREKGIPVFNRIDDLMINTKALINYGQLKNMNSNIIKRDKNSDKYLDRGMKISTKGVLSRAETHELFQSYGIPMVKECGVMTLKEAKKQAGKLGWPIVLKVSNEVVVHKTEINGISLNIDNENKLIESFERLIKLQENYMDSCYPLVMQQQILNGTELILGISRDQEFGPVVLVGFGGIFVEVVKDFVLGIPPIDEVEAQSMLRRLKAFPLLEGFRGRPAADLRQLSKVIIALSQMAMDFEDCLESIDINPFIIDENGCGWAIDKTVIMDP